MTKKRKYEIKLAVLSLLSDFGNVKLPMPIKAIAKSLPNCRLIKYSKYMYDQNISYKDIISILGTEDACSDYDFTHNRYIIYYNDLNDNIMSSNRLRWNIAHEIGHIVLGHHKNENCRICRNSLSTSEYRKLENEADTFAAYILVPHMILKTQRIRHANDIANICKISSKAANNRYQDYCDWIHKHDENDTYDKEIKQLFYKSIKTQDKIFCSKCNSLTGYIGIKYCRVCGNEKAKYLVKGLPMVYNEIEMNSERQVKMCPVCGNEKISPDSEFCQICGCITYNSCVNYISENGFITCEKGHRLKGDARFCPYCGSETTFLQKHVLKPWDEEPIDTAEKNNAKPICDDELPF